MATESNATQEQVNLVGKGTVFEGTLRAEHDVRTSGKIIGTLRVEGKAMVAESGSVEGEVFATSADVAGDVQGDLHVEERLMLKSSARVEGTIETDRLVVEEGAQFTGECAMGDAREVDASEDEAVSRPDRSPMALGQEEQASETGDSDEETSEDEASA